jgi:beta-lactamase class A
VPSTDTTLGPRLATLFADAGVTGYLHVRDIDSGRSAGFQEGDQVTLGSSRKVALLLELIRGIDSGEWDGEERIKLHAPQPPPIGYGIAQLRDDVEVSLRDLATMMISVSDNVATATIAGRVGADRVNRTLARLGVPEFVFRHPTYDMAAHDPDQPFAVPALGARATAEAATLLLSKIWLDEAGSPAACADIRRILGTQVFTHRLRSGFPDEVRTAGKTGSWMGWKNEIGVAEFPDGRRYAIAVFTCLLRPPEQLRLTPQDLVIGSAAAAAVEWLRASG